MYSARPIIVMFSGYPSMINEAECGCFIPSEDSEALVLKLEEYFNMSGEVLDELGERGKQFLLEKRNYSVLAKEYLNVLS